MKLRFSPRIEIEIFGRDFWVKVVDFLQQNWVLILPDDILLRAMLAMSPPAQYLP